MKSCFEITSDCLDIVKRIKVIDKDYFVMFNVPKQKFELHHKTQLKKTYCLTFPFDTLDERAVTYVLKTRVQNSDEIFEKMERENQRLKRKQALEVLNDFKEKMNES